MNYFEDTDYRVYRNTEYRKWIKEPPVAEFSGTPLSGTNPLEVTFTDASTGGTIDSWSWNFGDGETSTDQNPTHEYTDAGIYTVALTVTNTNELSDTETKTDYIHVYNLIVRLNLDELALRLEDTEEKIFPDDVKIKALNVAQLQIVRNLKHEYLQDLEVIESDIDISSGEYSLSSLTYTLILDEEGLFAVRVTIDDTNYWGYKLTIDQVRQLENTYFLPAESVFYYIYENKLYVTTSSDLSLTGATADVFFLKKPTDCTLYVAPDLSTEYNHILLSLAESYCWQIEGRQDRAQAVGKMARLEIKNMNYRFKEIPQIGV